MTARIVILALILHLPDKTKFYALSLTTKKNVESRVQLIIYQ